MKKQILITMVVVAMLLLPLSSAMATDVFISATETLQWNPDKAYEGYNLFNVNGQNTYLVDMEGRIVNEWEGGYDGTPMGMYAFLMENGNLRAHQGPSYAPGGNLNAGGAQGRLSEYNWAGERIWTMDLMDGEDVNGDGVLDEDDYVPITGFGGARNGYFNGSYRFHHDAQRMYNDAIDEWTYMVLIWVSKDQTDADYMGVDPALNRRSRTLTDDAGTAWDESTSPTWSPCALIEVLPDYESGVGGDVIWYWTFTDHMVTADPGGTAATVGWDDWAGRASTPPTVLGAGETIADYPNLLDVNGMHYSKPDGPRADYQHCNSFDYDETTGYVAINAKAANEFFVVDHDGTFLTGATADDWSAVGLTARGPAGDFLYRFGNRANYGQGKPAGFFDEGDMEMYGTHDIQFIMDSHWRPPYGSADTWTAATAEYALPGAGNFLMFDNGCYNPMNAGSNIREVNPYEDGGTADDTASGFQLAGISGYVDSADLPRRAQVPWVYGEGPQGRNNPYNFYSSYISSAQRLPNDNTIVCSGATSHFFEVTDDKEVVWEYLLPHVQDGVFQTTKGGQGGADMAFRFHRYAADHPALAGRDLTPGPTMTGRTPSLVGEVVSAPVVSAPPPAPTGWGTSGLTAGDGGGGDADGTGGGTGSGAY
jgi:hypothetical protein